MTSHPTTERTSSAPDSTRIAVVTVSYKSLPVMRDWFRLTSDDNIHVTVVDNFGEDGLEAFADGIGAEYIRAPGNIGFGRGCNLGVHDGADHNWVALVNPDTAVTNDQLQKLAKNAPKGTVAVSALLTSAEGTPQADLFRRPVTPAIAVATWLVGSRGPLARRKFAPIPTSGERHKVQVTSGSCLLVRRSAWDACGGFPDWIFLNSEDAYLFHRLAPLGQIEVDATVRVPHMKGSASTVVPRPAIRAETARSLAMYTLAVHGVLAWATFCLANTLGFLLRYPSTPKAWPMAWRLLTTEVREGRAYMQGKPIPAGPVFVGESP